MKTLLLVDDENEMREDLAVILARRCGVQVLTAANAKEALIIFEAKKPDGVFLDNGLPDMLGIDVLAQMKILNKDSKIYMLTGQESPSLCEKAKTLGATDFLTKPLSLAIIVDVVKGL